MFDGPRCESSKDTIPLGATRVVTLGSFANQNRRSPARQDKAKEMPFEAKTNWDPPTCKQTKTSKVGQFKVLRAGKLIHSMI